MCAKTKAEWKLEGERKLRAQLEQKANITSDAIQTVIDRYSLLIARDAKRNAPVDLGRLRAAIFPVLRKHAARVQAGGEIGGVEVKYAAVQEFGSKKKNIPAVRYMRRAFNKHKDDYRRDIIRATAKSFGA